MFFFFLVHPTQMYVFLILIFLFQQLKMSKWTWNFWLTCFVIILFLSVYNVDVIQNGTVLTVKIRDVRLIG